MLRSYPRGSTRPTRRALVTATVVGVTIASAVAHTYQVGERESNDTAPTANLHKAIDISRGAINLVGDVDYWLAVGQPGDLAFAYASTVGATPSTDSRLALLRSNGTTLLEQDDSSGPGASSCVAGAALFERMLFYRIQEDGDNSTLSPYRLFALTVHPADSMAESEGNGSVGSADPITATSVTATLPGGDHDYFSFFAYAGDDLVLITDDDPDENGEHTDTSLRIRDASDNDITGGLYDDNNSNPCNAAGPIVAPSTGTYYAHVFRGGAGTDTDYRLVVLVAGRPAVPPRVVAEVEPNDTAAQADPLRAGHVGAGRLSSVGGTDWWGAAADVGDLAFAYVDTLGATASADSLLQIYRSDGSTLIEADDDDGPGASSVVAGLVAPTDLYLRVSESGDDQTMSPFALWLAVASPFDTAAETESNGTLGSADPLTATVQTGTFGSFSDIDYYAFRAEAGQRVVLIADDDPDDDGLIADTELSLRDGADATLPNGDGDDGASADGNAAGAVTIPSTGTYYARVANGGDGNDDDYRFVVLVGGLPARGGPSAPLVECGDNVVEGVEVCDDGNTADCDGCRGDCSAFETGCGDGFVCGTEECDDQNDVDCDGCSSGCVVETGCGDGVQCGSELCDDGNTADCDGCRGDCSALETGCGDGFTCNTEECDDGDTDDCDGCSSACVLETGCGDGVQCGSEACDDGNTDDCDGCSASCVVETGCGDGAVCGSEVCDDGNTDDCDGCRGDCSASETGCGDGFACGDEACDDGNTDDCDGCSGSCMVETGCGDGAVCGAEVCDDGNTDDCDGCRGDCSASEMGCGDGFVCGTEECDDANTSSGDGCSQVCRVEAGYVCEGEPSSCEPGGAGGAGTGGAAGAAPGGSGGTTTTPTEPDEEGGCGCRAVGGARRGEGLLAMLLGLLLVGARRRRSRQQP